MRRTGWRWALVPWSDSALIAVLALATAVPAALVSAAEIWERVAADVLAVTVLEDAPADLGPTVSSEVRFDADGLEAADALLVEAFEAVEGVGTSVRTTFTLPALGVVADRRIGPPVRLVGRAGAADDLVVVTGDPSQGAAISTWMATEYHIGIGDVLTIESVATGDSAVNDIVPGGGADATIVVTAICEPLWSSDSSEVPAAWQDVPELVPRYLSPLGGPGFALVIVPEAQLWASGGSGIVQWVAPLDVPTTSDGLHRVARDYAALERALVQDDGLTAAFDRVGRPVAGAPVLESALGGVLVDLDRATSLTSTPLGTSQSAGLAVSIGLSAAAGVSHERRRRRDVRLLVAEGRRWPGLAGIAAVQVATPGFVGTSLGVAGGVLAAWTLGPADRMRWTEAPVAAAMLTGVAAVGVISLVSGIRGQRALAEPAPLPARIRVAGGVAGSAATALLWIEVGRRGAGPEDLTTAIAPLAIVGLAVAVGVAGLATAIRLIGPPKATTGGVALLVRQRLRNSPPNVPAAVLGLGLGLLLFTLGSADAIDVAVETRAATAVGAETRLDLFGPMPATRLPPDASLLRVLDSRVTPGGGRIRVVAIDPETFASVAAWPAEFGSTAADVVALLATADVDDIAGVVIGGEGLPSTGAFGGRRDHPYTVVGEVRSLPLARSFGPTMLVSAPRVDEVGRERAISNGEDPDRLPPATARFRGHVLASTPADEATADLEAAGFGVRDAVSLRSQTMTPPIIATRFALQYQRLFGLVMTAGAAVGMAMLLTSQRRRRHTAIVMLRSMGMRTRDLAAAIAIESAATVAVAATGGAIGAWLASGRLLGALDPTPRALPPPTPSGALLLPAALVAGAAAVCGIAAWTADLVLAARTTTLDADGT